MRHENLTLAALEALEAGCPFPGLLLDDQDRAIYLNLAARRYFLDAGVPVPHNPP